MSSRLECDINDETQSALEELAARRDTTVTEIFRRAVSVFKFIDDNIHEGCEMRLVDRPSQSNS